MMPGVTDGDGNTNCLDLPGTGLPKIRICARLRLDCFIGDERIVLFGVAFGQSRLSIGCGFADYQILWFSDADIRGLLTGQWQTMTFK
jgi:hypothetical protein